MSRVRKSSGNAATNPVVAEPLGDTGIGVGPQSANAADVFVQARAGSRRGAGATVATGDATNVVVGRIGSRRHTDVTTLAQCIKELRRLTLKLEGVTSEARHGGMLVLGGFEILDTKTILAPKLYPEVLAEYRKVVKPDRSKTQQSFYLPPDDGKRGPIPNLIRAHRDLCLALLRAKEPGWISHGSSLLFLNQQLQSEFHDHLTVAERSDPNHKVCRQNASATFRREGTLFNSPKDDDPFQCAPGDTAIFNEGARHMSPPKAKDGFFLLHFFAKAKADASI